MNFKNKDYFFAKKLNQLRVYVPIRKMEEESNKKKSSSHHGSKAKAEATPQRMDYEVANPNTGFVKVIEPISNKWFPLRQFIEVFKTSQELTYFLYNKKIENKSRLFVFIITKKGSEVDRTQFIS